MEREILLFCNCGGMLLVVSVEEYPNGLSSKDKLSYNRVCDVECQKCGKVYYSQSYDEGNGLNLAKDTKKLI